MSLSKALTAAAGNAGESLYVEDVFSTYLYTGTGAAQTITNGIDLSGEGGLVWAKSRTGTRNHILSDTERGTGRVLFSNLTAAEDIDSTTITSYNSDGFSMGSSTLKMNTSGEDFVSWTFRKAEKFFDVVTYTGNGGVQNISHNLGAVPAVIIVKNTQSSYDWGVYTASTGNGSLLLLNSTSAAISPANQWNNTTPTDSVFTVGNTNTSNRSGQTYVAYLFASDAGGFGDDGSESIIKCGSWDATGNNEVNLGFEPQWILIKNADGGNKWGMFDSMRGWTADGNIKTLPPNSSSAESSESGVMKVTSTGFTWIPSTSGNTYIYIAIRRPMKTPESGTEVFSPVSYTGNNGVNTIESGFTVDAELVAPRSIVRTWKPAFASRLTGTARYITTSSTAAEQTDGPSEQFAYNTGVLRNGTNMNSSADSPLITWMFKRATGFFDVVAYTGDGTNKVIPHNLGVKPELIITKPRSNPTSSSTDWIVYAEPLTNSNFLYLNTNSAAVGAALYPSEPTADNYTVLGGARIGDNGGTNISYLFATLAGVSKVGSYTGTGTDLNVDCGFAAGARFILIKRTDSTGDWYVWDSARGIVAGNDPYLLFNSDAIEVTSTDYIDPLSSGFTVTSSAPAALNSSGGNYIFLAIAQVT